MGKSLISIAVALAIIVGVVFAMKGLNRGSVGSRDTGSTGVSSDPVSALKHASLSPEAAAKRLMDWREAPNDAAEHRERALLLG